MTFRVRALGALSVAAALAAVAAPAAAATTDTAGQMASTIVAQLEGGTLDRSQLSDELNGDLTDQALGLDYHIFHGRETPKAMTLRSRVTSAGRTTYVYKVDFPDGAISMTMGVDDRTAKVTALYFRPSYL